MTTAPHHGRVPSGWYPDPWRMAPWRWWDGAAWTGAVSGAVATTARRPRMPAWLSWPVGVAGVIAVPVLILAVVLTPVSALLALVPICVVLPALLWMDRVEPEPRQARLHAFLWGATVSVLVAGTINSIVAVAVSETAAAVVSAPLVEEAMKGLGIWMAFRRREVDTVMDGLVYAGWVGIGFAVVEDVQYFAVASSDGTLAATFVMRALLTPFAHPLFTAWTGLAIGRAVVAGRSVFPSALGGYAIAVALHAAWNGSLTAAATAGSAWIALGAAAVFVGIFVGSVLMVVRRRRVEQAAFVSSIAFVAPRYGITPDQGMVFTDWRTITAARRQLPRSERRRFDRQHAALARLVALHLRGGGRPGDEERLVAAWHDSIRPER